MKQTYIVFFFVLLLAFPVWAEDATGGAAANESIYVDSNVDSQAEAVEGAGITPQSPFYGIDVALDRIALALERNPQKKVAKGLLIAQERLLEVQEMAARGKYDLMDDAEQEHGKVLSGLETSVDEIEGDNSSAELRAVIDAELGLEDHKGNVRELTISIKGHLSDAQVASLVDTVLSNLDAQTTSLEIRIENKKGKTKIKIEQEGGDADAVEADLEDELGLTEKEDENARKALEHAEEQISGAQNKIDLEASKGSNTTDSENLLVQAQDLYAEALDAFSAGDFVSVEDLAAEAWDLANEARKGKNFEHEEEEENDTGENESSTGLKKEKVEGSISSEAQTSLDSFVSLLESSGTTAEVSVTCKDGSCDTELDGELSAEEQTALDALVAELEGSGNGEIKIELETDFSEEGNESEEHVTVDLGEDEDLQASALGSSVSLRASEGSSSSGSGNSDPDEEDDGSY